MKFIDFSIYQPAMSPASLRRAVMERWIQSLAPAE